MSILAGIEAGGTKFVCGVGTDKGEIIEKVRIETHTAAETMPMVCQFLIEMDAKYGLDAIGIGCFGPIEPDPLSDQYGHITTTTKPGWQNFDMVSCVRQAVDVPIGFDTDVNAAALGEYYWGNACNLTDFLYLTVGTGIGGGGMVNGQLVHGSMHPEMGHIMVPIDRQKDHFAGNCAYHGQCLEGMAAGPAIKERWQVDSALDLPPDHVAWQLEAEYLAYALTNFILVLSPQRIIMGGGVMKQSQLFPIIRDKTRQYLAGYIKNSSIDNIDQYIVPPGLKSDAGLAGSLALAKQAALALSNNTWTDGSVSSTFSG